MLLELKKYIFKNLEEWGLQAQTLSPLFRFNKEANGLVRDIKIGTVIFWFSENSKSPLFITKVLSPDIVLQELEETRLRLSQLPYYPKIYAITQFEGQDPIVMMETIEGNTYEMELSHAIHGPEGNFQAILSCIRCHFSEMGEVFREFSHIERKEKELNCGDWAYQKGRFLQRCLGFEMFTDELLVQLQKILEPLPCINHHIIIDHNVANIFPGPYFVDQLDVSTIYQVREEEPGIFDPIRFLIAYFRASPLNAIYKDWVRILGCCLHDTNRELMATLPLQEFLNKTGLGNYSHETFWALMVMGLALRVQDELKFHANSVCFQKLQSELFLLLKSLISNHFLFVKQNKRVFEGIIKTEKAFVFHSNKKSKDISNVPVLFMEGYKRYNLIRWEGDFYAVRQSVGDLDLMTVSLRHKEKLIKTKRIIIARSSEALMKNIDCDVLNNLVCFLQRCKKKARSFCS